MGQRITVDSATMLNKGLEIIEACRLFNLPPSRVRVAEVQVGARAKDEQPGAVLSGELGRGQRSPDRREGLLGRPGQHPALRQRPVQVHHQLGVGGVAERPRGHPDGRCPVAGPVERVREPAGQPPVPA